MTAALPPELTGRKGGSSKPKEPSEAVDSLRSIAKAKMLIAVGEGEFAGAPTAQTIYLDNTPLADAQGNSNFTGVSWEWRPGTVEQSYIPGLPSVENETTINVELRSTTAWVRSVSNTQLSAVRLRFAWPALQQQDSEGNINGYRIEYAVDVSTDGGAYQQVLLEAVDGKTTTRYERSRRIDLPKATSGWQVRVRRITPNQNNNRIADAMSIAGITEVIDAKLRYPNTALLYVEFSAEQFSNIPAVTLECNARKVQVPTTYDPVSRTYSGVWDGSFKSAWTNNPAWITFDVATNDRFGLGKRIKPWMVDKYELYRIAQYCDQLVPDGKGGQEPRYLCDLNLQSRSGAWELLRDISAIYRGMTYWAQGQLNVQADIPRSADFDFAFTRANVIDGKFTYGSSSERTRYTRALVSYDNPANNYDTDVAAASDAKLQRRYGDNPVEISAIGCSRESEAQRRGKWILLTNSQDRTVTFRVGMDGRIPLPGHVIPVADKLISGAEIGGRISAAAGTVITLDRDTRAKAGDRLIINLPSGACEGRTIRQVAGRQIAVTTAYSETPQAELVWTLDADDLAVPLYRVMKVTRPEEGVFEISALQFEPSKFAAIDTGAKLESRPISILPTGTVEAPASVALSAYHAVNQGITVTTMTISWTAVPGAVAYDVEWRKDSGNWVRIQRTGSVAVDVPSIYAGGYLARVRAVNAVDIASVWKTSSLTQLTGKVGAPPALAQLKTTPGPWKITLDWAFPAEGAADSAYTEIQQATTAQGDNAQSIGLFAYPTNTYTLNGLAAGARLFFRGRLIDRIGNVGPWTSWVSGMSSADASEYNQLITEEFVKSALGQELLDEIDKIPVIESDLAQERSDRAAAIVAEQQARQSGLQQVAQVAADNLAAEASARGQAIINEATIRQAADEQMSSRIQGVYAQVNPPMAGGSWAAGSTATYAGVWSEQFARAQGDAAEALARDTLSAQLRGGYSGTDPNQVTSGLIYQERRIRLSAEQVLSQQISLVSAGVGEQFDSGAIWYFDNGVDGWTGNGTPTASGGFLRPANAALASVYSPAGLAVNADTYRQVRFRIKRTGIPSWNGRLYWGENWANSMVIDAPTFDVNGVSTVILNLSWAGTVAQIRLDLGSQGNADFYELDWVAIGRASPGASYAALSAEQTARASADQAMAEDIRSLTARVADPKTGNTALSSSVDTLIGRADNTEAGLSAVTTRVSGIYAQVNPPLAGANDWYAGSPTVLAGVYSEQFARAEADNALGKSVETVNAKTEKNAAAIVAEQNARSNADSALAESITKVQASTADNAALIQNEQKARTDADSAFANQMSLVQASVKDNAALIKNEQEARVSGDSALAKQVQDTQASLGNTNASVQQISQAQVATDNKVNATWAVKLGVTAEGTYYMAGIGASIEPNGGTAGLQSTVAVAADRFLVLGPGIDGKGKAFFSVVNGQTFMDSAFINKAYIANALIGQTVQSQSYTNFSEPVMTQDFANGDLISRSAGRRNTYSRFNRDGVSVVVDGVLRVRMGTW